MTLQPGDVILTGTPDGVVDVQGRRRGRDRDRGHRRLVNSSSTTHVRPLSDSDTAMRIDHLIDGKPVAGRDYFETVNPATQEVLAEVASGGAAEVNAAVAAAKAAFPAWAATPGAPSAPS